MGKNIFKFLISSKLNFKKALKNYKTYDAIKESGLFDEEFYINKYSNKDHFKDPLTHYLFKGYKKGYIPSLNFDPDFYLKTYKNVKYANINPVLHYIAHGKNEGKIIQKPRFLRRKEEICQTNLSLLNNYKFEEEPLVSIIILNRDGLSHLKRLFHDFNKKTNYNNFEIIVVDNGSCDESVDFLKSLKKELPIKIIENKENVSFSKGNNDAAKIANGEYLLLLNNDIEPTYGWLNELVGTMVNNENVGAVGAKLIFPYYFNENKDKSFTIQHSGDIFAERMYPCCLYAINKTNKSLKTFDCSINKNIDCIAVTGAVMLIKKSVYQKFNGLNEEYNYGLEDVDLSLKLNKNGYRIVYCGNALLFHHESSTRVKNNDYVNNDKRNYKIFWNIWGDYLSKNLLLDKLDNNRFFTEKQLKIVIHNQNYKNNLNSQKFTVELSNELYSKEYELDLITKLNDYYLGNSTDILISFSSDYNLKNIISRKDLVKVFIFDEFNNEVSNDSLKGYDIIITSNKDKYIKLKDNFKFKHVLYIPFTSYKEYTNEFLKEFREILNNSDGFLWDSKMN